MNLRDGRRFSIDAMSSNTELIPSEKCTLFTEYETISIALEIVRLIELLHEKDIVHTNLNPDSILLREGDYRQMCYRDLYHCMWNTKQLLSKFEIHSSLEDNVSLFDTRTRDREYLSPE